MNCAPIRANSRRVAGDAAAHRLTDGGPKSSSGMALAVVRVRRIAQGGLDLSSKAMELHGVVARFIFHPSHHAEPAVSMMSGTTTVAGTRGAATNEPFQ